MRLGVYTDYTYVREGGQLYAERAFAVFLGRLAPQFERMTLIGRLNPQPAQARYPIPEQVELVALPYYEQLTRPWPVLRSMLVSVRRFWRALDDLDAVWLLGPHPQALVFALLAGLRRRPVFLGVRHDSHAYIRSRHPGRRAIHLAAGVLDGAFALLARRCPIVVVGPALRHRYPKARALLELTVSLVETDDLVESEAAHARQYDGEVRILSVGRLEEEKNPLMLADVLARLSSENGRSWRLVVCGEGPLEEALAQRLAKLGLGDRATLRGYVPLTGGMREAYRESHFLLHTSWTEGLPQVLIEAFAAGLPVVATDVGGIREAVGETAVLVPAGDPDAAARALLEVADDSAVRARLVDRSLEHARDHTIDHEIARLAAFLTSAGRPS